jgi:hypothetical protein
MKKKWVVTMLLTLLVAVASAAATVNIDSLGLKIVEKTDQTVLPLNDIMPNIKVLPSTEKQRTEKAIVDISDLSLQVTEGKITKIAPKSFYFSGSLDPGYAALHGSFAWSKGDKVKVSVSWTPGNQNIYVGIYDRNTGEGIAVEFTGGSDQYEFTVPWGSNNWAVFVGNPSTNAKSVQYSGYVEEL